jgi:hypothetical protein
VEDEPWEQPLPGAGAVVPVPISGVRPTDLRRMLDRSR